MPPARKDLKLALVGPGAVGKDTLSEFAALTYNLSHISSSDLIRHHIVENNLGVPDRVLMRHIGTQLRAEHGADYLVRQAIAIHGHNIVLSGLRAVAEVTTFIELGGIVIAVDAPLEHRFAWAQSRADIDSGMTFEQFKARDAAESANTDPNAQNVNAVMKLAHTTIVNDADKDALCEKLRVFVDSIVKT